MSDVFCRGEAAYTRHGKSMAIFLKTCYDSLTVGIFKFESFKKEFPR